MNKDEQADAVWKGEFLEQRLEGAMVVQLYSVGNFYVEVFYDQTHNHIDMFRPFKSTNLLAPYLHSINIKL